MAKKEMSAVDAKRAAIAEALARMPKQAVDYPVTRKVTVTEAERPNPMRVFYVDFFNEKQFVVQKAEGGKGVEVLKRNIKTPSKGFELCGTTTDMADAIFGMVTGRYARFGR
jgi:hypothetical protein